MSVADRAANGYSAASNGNGHANGHASDLVRTAVLESAAPAAPEVLTDEDGQLLAPEGDDIIEDSLSEPPGPDTDPAPPKDAPADDWGEAPTLVGAQPAAPGAGQGGAALPTAEATVAPAPAPPRRAPLRLVLEESGDEAADQARLARLFDLLRANPGGDPVLLTIRTREGEETDLALPSARVDEALETELQSATSGAPVTAVR
jgi:hypothetical protein